MVVAGDEFDMERVFRSPGKYLLTSQTKKKRTIKLKFVRAVRQVYALDSGSGWAQVVWVGSLTMIESWRLSTRALRGTNQIESVADVEILGTLAQG
jgi:hypothetical protein